MYRGDVQDAAPLAGGHHSSIVWSETDSTAAAISAADGHTADLPFVTNDRRLAAAARKEGFPVITSEDKAT